MAQSGLPGENVSLRLSGPSNRLIEMLRDSLIRGRGSPLVRVSISTALLTDASTLSLTLSSAVHISTGHAVNDQRLPRWTTHGARSRRNTEYRPPPSSLAAAELA